MNISNKKQVLDNCISLLNLILQPVSKKEEFLESFNEKTKIEDQATLSNMSCDWAMVITKLLSSHHFDFIELASTH